LHNPLEIIWPFHSDGHRLMFGIYGMSYHGGLIGVILAVILFCRRKKIGIWRLADLIVPAGPLGYAFGR